MKTFLKKISALVLALVLLTSIASAETLQIGIPDDGTNLSRGIKLLEAAGLLTVDPEAGFTPEIADITGYLYDVEVVPVQANTLPSTLGDFAASTINGTYAIPTGLIPSRDGLIIESHCNPDCAWSDAKQQVTPDVLDYILNLLVIRSEKQTTENLAELRKQIDECDNELIQILAKRMRVAREIGTYKKEHEMTILQTGRYNEILDKRGSQGALCGMDADFIKKVFEAIHEESVRQQMEIINK